MTLKEMRRAAKLTQAVAAEALGVTQASLSAWERAEARPTMEKLKPTAALYGVSLEALVDAITGEGSDTHGRNIYQPRPRDQGRESPAPD